MALDHSLTYRRKTLRNLPHRLRLKKILKVVESFSPKQGDSFLDIGCSNGYITQIIFSTFRLTSAKGLDHTKENIELARSRYPNIYFDFVDLNVSKKNQQEKFQIITCLETLEHVGDLSNAIDGILSFGQKDSRILITVPIEVGMVGIMKFLVKTLLLNYKLDELKDKPSWFAYCLDLFTRRSISKHRDSREGWGTHFGFDYHEVDKILMKRQVSYKSFNSFSTRFYLITSGK